MPGSRLLRAGAIAWLLALGAWPLAPSVPVSAQAAAAPSKASSLPDRLGDAEFWALVSDISEPGGYFRITDNYTSNEREVGQVFTMLGQRGVQGGVYMGVGPEQNLSYIAAIRPAMAFVVDIRRQAVMQHLMFKAVFELAKDRADFISLLFSKPRPAGLDGTTPIQKMWDAYAAVATDSAAAAKNATRIIELLTKTHKFAFTADESAQLTSVLGAFVAFGPSISTRGAGGGGGRRGAAGGAGDPWMLGLVGSSLTFADLTGWCLDAAGQPQSFLSTEDHFRTVKALEDKNLLVPVSGDFGGPKAVRAIGAYLHKHGGTVSAFYVSNVEQYLFQDGKQAAFYDNVATLPIADTSVFIRPYALRGFGGASLLTGARADEHALCGIAGFLKAASAGRVFSNSDALACAR